MSECKQLNVVLHKHAYTVLSRMDKTFNCIPFQLQTIHYELKMPLLSIDRKLKNISCSDKW